MQAVCDVLEQLIAEGALKHYAIGGATAAGFHGEPLATRDIDVFVFVEPPLALCSSRSNRFSPTLPHSASTTLMKRKYSSMDSRSNSSARLPAWKQKPSNRQWWRSGKTTASESCARSILPPSRSPSAARKTAPDWSILWNFQTLIACFSPTFWLATRCKPAGMSGPTHWASKNSFPKP